MKQVTFSFSLSGAALGALIAEHSQDMNIQVFNVPDKKTRQKQLPGNGAQLQLPAPKSGTAAADVEATILAALVEAKAPMYGRDIIVKVKAKHGGTGSSFYAAVKRLKDAGTVLHDGKAYSLPPKNKKTK